jgi:hypothetical protein
MMTALEGRSVVCTTAGGGIDFAVLSLLFGTIVDDHLGVIVS